MRINKVLFILSHFCIYYSGAMFILSHTTLHSDQRITGCSWYVSWFPLNSRWRSQHALEPRYHCQTRVVMCTYTYTCGNWKYPRVQLTRLARFGALQGWSAPKRQSLDDAQPTVWWATTSIGHTPRLECEREFDGIHDPRYWLCTLHPLLCVEMIDSQKQI